MRQLIDGRYDYQQLSQGINLLHNVASHLLMSRVSISKQMELMNIPDYMGRVKHDMTQQIVHELEKSGKINIEKIDYMKDYNEKGIEPPPVWDLFTDDYEMGVIVLTPKEFNEIIEVYTKSLINIRKHPEMDYSEVGQMKDTRRI